VEESGRNRGYKEKSIKNDKNVKRKKKKRKK